MPAPAGYKGTWLSADVHREAKTQAAREGRPLQELVTDAVAAYLESRTNPGKTAPAPTLAASNSKESGSR